MLRSHSPFSWPHAGPGGAGSECGGGAGGAAAGGGPPPGGALQPAGGDPAPRRRRGPEGVRHRRAARGTGGSTCEGPLVGFGGNRTRSSRFWWHNNRSSSLR